MIKGSMKARALVVICIEKFTVKHGKFVFQVELQNHKNLEYMCLYFKTERQNFSQRPSSKSSNVNH